MKNNKDPLIQLQSTIKGLERYLKNLMSETKGLKLNQTLKVAFKNKCINQLILTVQPK